MKKIKDLLKTASIIATPAVKTGDRVTFLVDAELKPGEHTLAQVGEKFHLLMIREAGDMDLMFDHLGEFTSLDEAKRALDAVRSTKH